MKRATHPRRQEPALDVCVVGSAMMDLLAYAPRRPQRGETLLGTGFASIPGGKGVNQAIAAARAGAKTAFVGAVGIDAFGDEFLDLLDREGVDRRYVLRSTDLSTGVGLPVVEPGGYNSIVIVPQANMDVTTDVVQSARSVVVNTKVLLLQLEIPVEAALAAALMAREAGAIVVLNPAPATDLPAALIGSVDFLVPNEVELGQLAGASVGDSETELAEVTSELLADMPGLRAVIVTRGEKPTLIADSIGQRLVATYPVEAVDSVGAGDVFCGYLAAQLANGTEVALAVRNANAAASVSVTGIGAVPSIPYRDDVESLVVRHATMTPREIDEATT